MKWLLIYAYFTCSRTEPLKPFDLPVYSYYNTAPALGFTSFEGNKKHVPFSINTISIKDFSCTFASFSITVNKKGKLDGQLKILYLNVKYLWPG